ncbi:MAG: Mrp/NBP35 family ATP-binding protein [Acidobacteria bacterium]|uniref:Iron-sulfur cluster carrier protein n=1 Tax=Candidatus Polarisedimenticola svalbardensis TaxID=2886004 RepID=A0A8J6XR95_9BACT|nr:Mrp/NBP35 family ATP-binding protein [Candidatus Polarisedimenticola svalbardensis]
MSIQEKTVLEKLAAIPYPGYSRDIVSFGIVRSVTCSDGKVVIQLDLGTGDRSVLGPLRDTIKGEVSAMDGVTGVDVRVTGAADGLKMADPNARPGAAQATGLENELLPGVRNVIAVASGKGGVGKSTVAVNLAIALAKTGASVGLLDADIYGPSIPIMLGLADRKPAVDGARQKLLPFERYGIRFMSLGFMVERNSPVIWRGPMVMKALEQLMRDVDWGDLDILVLDMPPGTGDAQLTVSQKVSLAGAVIVTTPQDVALADAVRGVAMFQKVEVPILGIIENMSFFCCPGCGTRTEIFGHGGGKSESERQSVPFLGEIPLDSAIRDGGDAGRPVIVADPDGANAGEFQSIAAKILDSLGTDTDRAGGGIFQRLKKGLKG